VSPDGSSVWVTNLGGDTVSRIATTNDAVTSIAVGGGPVGVAVSPDGSSVWVTNFGGGTVSRISTAAPYAVTSIPVGAGPTGVAASPDGSSVWVTNGDGTTVSRISTAAPYTATSIPVGSEPTGVAVSPDGSSVWVTNSARGTVSRIATSNNAVTPITVGANSYGVAVSPDGSSVWVTNSGGTTVSRIIFPPQPPLNVTATPGDAKATISWSAPTNTGGSPITGYSATASPGGKSCTTTTATSCTISGLTNGTTYSVSVTATNAVGTSDPSDTVSVTLPIPATLAATGSDLVSPSWFVVALFGLGGGALLVSRRRKHQAHS
jgi:YVTN family beta-propeller protein